MSDIQTTLNQSIITLKGIRGLQAVVLGGSRATGTDQPGSDIDVGLYYDESLDLDQLQLAAQKLDDDHRTNLVAPPGGWGNWVNGGGWLVVDGVHLDLILRETARVKQAVLECDEGIVSSHYQPGHPHAFTNVMYRGELAICKMLWAASDELLELKRHAELYPEKLKYSLLNFFGFEMGFSLDLAKNYVLKEDRYYVMAHLVRSVSALNQVLFALNEKYCLNEKKAVRNIESFPIHPINYKDRLDQVFLKSGIDMPTSCEILAELIKEVRGLMPS
ncbi:MAG: nucleotidyltransferase domain-containing protein [Anaerolineaceae bacterium]|nr:nucleotidyltransferase domain-containing protein [Anaerolineaceae bacterium]